MYARHGSILTHCDCYYKNELGMSTRIPNNIQNYNCNNKSLRYGIGIYAQRNHSQYAELYNSVIRILVQTSYLIQAIR